MHGGGSASPANDEELIADFAATGDNLVIVDWNGPDDPDNPFNWSKAQKWLVTFIALFTTFLVLANGTIITVAHYELDQRFHVSEATFANSYWPVTTWALGGSFFSLIILPTMEDFGIRRTFLLTHFTFILFLIPQAVAQNFATLIVTRFFAGGCVAVLGNSAASVIGNIWASERERTIPVGLWILAYLGGSSIGPVLGASILQFLSWRWISYMQLIWHGLLFPVAMVTMRESRDLVILKQRAKKLRAKGINAYTRHEILAEPILDVLKTSIQRPLKMLVTEYVVFFCMLWSSFTVGTLYLFTQSVEQVFEALYGWDPVQSGYVQGAIVIGEVLGWPLTLISARLYFHSAKPNPQMPGVPIPEARLYMSVAGAIVGLTGGMFVYAWTSDPRLPWIAPTMGLGMVGAGSVVVVTGIMDYVVDAYSNYAGSAMACVVLGENTFSAFLPLATMNMYQSLGLQWASSLLGFISLTLTLAPVCIIIWGAKIRARSPFMKEAMVQKAPAVNAEDAEDKITC
ncbi:MFS multidrug transporter [Aspergillus saccharolyticus JOP 1030-1]|uniref:MFS multidrug transporter n=1 Tax=Aspergillus saccharolyticus JOP 1030-1 TaxID=1450539 RepID=A0A318ZKN6_9EURO|nr:MFS multidrug transporter [Aspergillus saccharolyticus JOP 1030-1]PYH40798.1 MFS multidrug transporter [Aspergillus saccharolyticus JOP 1030-1]